MPWNRNNSKLLEIAKRRDALERLDSRPETAQATRLRDTAERAMLRHDIRECERIVTWAQDNPEADAVPALCAMLEVVVHSPSRYWHAEAWTDLRLRALAALRNIRSEKSLLTAANSVIYDVNHVSHEAAALLIDYGPDAWEPLKRAIDGAERWNVEGMQRAVACTGRVGNASACDTLIKILAKKAPSPTTIWRRGEREFRVAMMLLMTGCAIAALNEKNAGGEDFLLGLVMANVFAFGVASLVSGGIVSRLRKRGADRLSVEAALALVRINNPAVIPQLISMAGSSPYALHALQLLLPSVTAEHMGMLTGPQEDLLTGLLASADAPMRHGIVTALEYLGTGRSVGVIQRLVKRRPFSNDAGEFAVLRIEAERILKILEERKSKEDEAAMLLRYSEPTSGDTSQLLRAGSVQAEDNLMRAGSTEN